MNEAREIERAGLVVLEAIREARSATALLNESLTQMSWATEHLRQERLEWEDLENRFRKTLEEIREHV